MWDQPYGIKLNGKIINNICYADDTVILTDNHQDLKQLLQKSDETGGVYDLRTNVRKDKWMMITKQFHGLVLTINKENIVTVIRFNR